MAVEPFYLRETGGTPPPSLVRFRNFFKSESITSELPEKFSRFFRVTDSQPHIEIARFDWLSFSRTLKSSQLVQYLHPTREFYWLMPNMCEVFEGQNSVTTNRTVLPRIKKVINRQIITQNTNCHQVATTKLKS